MPNKKFIFRNNSNLAFIPTSHTIGRKKVFLTKEESDSAITQVAEVVLEKGEMVEMHIHKTMNEIFLFQEGECVVRIGNEELLCKTGSFVMILAGMNHSLFANTKCRFYTVGVAK